MYKDRANLSVRIPVKAVDGVFMHADGSPLPEFVAGAEFELVLSLTALKNEQDTQVFLATKTPTIGKEGTRVLVGLAPGSIPVGRCTFRLPRL